MMKTSRKCQLWRADQIHQTAMGLNLRLLEFPEKWRFVLTKLERVKINGKWEKELL